MLPTGSLTLALAVCGVSTFHAAVRGLGPLDFSRGARTRCLPGPRCCEVLESIVDWLGSLYALAPYEAATVIVIEAARELAAAAGGSTRSAHTPPGP
jgi:hypothetical protein